MRNQVLSHWLRTFGGVPDRYRAEDLVGVAEIAKRLGVGTSVVHDWQRRHEEFPSPIVRLKMGFLWTWPDVQAWARSTGRCP